MPSHQWPPPCHPPPGHKMDAPSLQSEDLANKLAFLGVLEFFLASWRPWRLNHLPIPEGSSECKQASQLPTRRKPIHVFEPRPSIRHTTRNRQNSFPG